jgi:hypothetical protein
MDLLLFQLLATRLFGSGRSLTLQRRLAWLLPPQLLRRRRETCSPMSTFDKEIAADAIKCTEDALHNIHYSQALIHPHTCSNTFSISFPQKITKNHKIVVFSTDFRWNCILAYSSRQGLLSPLLLFQILFSFWHRLYFVPWQSRMDLQWSESIGGLTAIDYFRWCFSTPPTSLRS